MDEAMGMSDLQFKAFLKQIVRSIEDALAEEKEEDKKKKLETLLEDLKGDIES